MTLKCSFLLLYLHPSLPLESCLLESGGLQHEAERRCNTPPTFTVTDWHSSWWFCPSHNVSNGQRGLHRPVYQSAPLRILPHGGGITFPITTECIQLKQSFVPSELSHDIPLAMYDMCYGIERC